jgi:putative phage-type endonuclease
MSEINLEQGSEDWILWRKKGIGSSDIGTILGVNTYKTAHELWMEKTGAKVPEDISNNYAVKRGQALEPLARDLFNSLTDSQFTPATFIDDVTPYFKFSADGIDFDKNEIIEIKSMGEKNHQKVIDTKAPSEAYLMQCLWGLMITKAKVCHFIAYNPSFPNPIEVLPIYPDENQFKIMTEKANIFWKMVEEKVWRHNALD